MKNLTLKKIEGIYVNRTQQVPEKNSFFSVLVPLVEWEEQLYLLYEVRADDMERQPGEICFPGGRVEEKERPESCARRETEEELGLEPEAIRIIAPLDTIVTHDNFTMTCFLGSIDYKKLKEATGNPAEVKETFLVPLSWLMEQDSTESSSYKFQDKLIWGLTGRITRDFIKILRNLEVNHEKY